MQCDNTEKRRRWRRGEGGEEKLAEERRKTFHSFSLFAAIQQDERFSDAKSQARNGDKKKPKERMNNTQMTLSRGRRRSTSWQSESSAVVGPSAWVPSECIYTTPTKTSSLYSLALNACLCWLCVYNKEARAEDKMKKRAKKKIVTLTSRLESSMRSKSFDDDDERTIIVIREDWLLWFPIILPSPRRLSLACSSAWFDFSPLLRPIIDDGEENKRVCAIFSRSSSWINQQQPWHLLWASKRDTLNAYIAAAARLMRDTFFVTHQKRKKNLPQCLCTIN